MDLHALLNKMTLKEKCYQLQQVNSDIYIQAEEMPITGPDFLLEFDNNYKYEVASVYNSFGAERNIKIQDLCLPFPVKISVKAGKNLIYMSIMKF